MFFTPDQVAELLRNVRSQIVCPRCQHSYPAGQVEPVELSYSRGIFAATCAGCSTQTLMTLNIREWRQRIATRGTQTTKVEIEKVTPGDVVDFASFLRSFDGDFEKMLAKLPKTNFTQQPQEDPPAGV